jgi:ferritin-like metal-binding protein YciE
MGIFTPDVKTLRELYTTELKNALNMERQIVEKGLPAMIEKSTSRELKTAFQNHLEESKEHVSRLERILAAGNQVEHHEIAVYGTLRNWAEVLGEDEHAAVFERTLEEEKNADALLTSLSEQINVAAPVA